MMALPIKKSGDVLLHLSSSVSHVSIGADGASTKTMNERPRKRREVRGRAAVARFTSGPQELSLYPGELVRLGRGTVNEGLKRRTAKYLLALIFLGMNWLT